MKVRMLVTAKTGDSRNVYFEMDGEYTDGGFDEARQALFIGDTLIDRDEYGRTTWIIDSDEIESTRFFYENDGDDITDW